MKKIVIITFLVFSLTGCSIDVFQENINDIKSNTKTVDEIPTDDKNITVGTYNENIVKSNNDKEKINMDQISDYGDYLKNLDTDSMSLNEIDIKYIEGKIAKYDIGFSLYNFNDNIKYSINGDKEFTAASTVKIAIAMSVSELVEQGCISFSDNLTYESEDYEGGTGSMQNDPIGSVYTVEECLNRMLSESDNIATQILLRLITREYYYKRINYYIRGEFDIENRTLSSDQGLDILRYLYMNPEGNPYFSKIIKYLKETIFDDRFSMYIDNDNIAHKIGSYDPMYADLALIYGKKDLALSIYCNEGYDICNSIAGDLGKYFYDVYENK